MQTYAQRTKRKPADPVLRGSAETAREMPNSIFGAGVSSQADISDPNLLSKIKSRQSGIPGRMQAQIPTAEREADSLSSGIGIGMSSPEAVKAEMGKRLGADLSNVQFHTDSKAEGYADSIGARAYTTGSDIYFGEGGFDPAVAAHELVHTAQQGVTEAAVPVTAAPPGGVQMLPGFLKKLFGRGGRQQQAPPVQDPNLTPNGVRKDDLQGQRDYMFNNAFSYRENVGDSQNIPIIAQQADRAKAPLTNLVQGLGEGYTTEQLYNQKGEDFEGGWAKPGGDARFSRKAIDMAGEYIQGLTGQLDTPEMTEYLASIGNMMGGTNYDTLKGSGAVSDFSNNVMSQLPTRGFSPVSLALSGGNKEAGKKVMPMNAIFGIMEKAYQTIDPETGKMHKDYAALEPILEKYKQLRSGTMEKVLPHIRDEVFDKLTPQEQEIAMAGGKQRPAKWFDDAEDTEGVDPAAYSPKQKAKMAHKALQKEDITDEHRTMMQRALDEAKLDFDKQNAPAPEQAPQQQQRQKKWWQFWK